MRITIDKVVAGLAFLLAATSLPAQQSKSRESDAIEYPPVYRIEAVVFSRAAGRSDQIRRAAPMDFTDRLDPLLVAQANDIAERELADLAAALPVAPIPGEIDQTTPWLEAEEQTLRPIPPVYSALGDLSRPIQRAFDRLIDATDYNPLTARAWTQLTQRGQPTAAMRIHNQTVVDLIAPDDDQRLVPVAHVLPVGPLLETPPPALDIYQLDGTLRLRQRQFLHLDLDLVWQTQARPLADRSIPTGGPSAATNDLQATENGWLLHRLQQSRIVEPGRLEYFDSSLFGVLVRIERFEQVVLESETPEPEPAAPDANLPESSETVEPVTNSGG